MNDKRLDAIAKETILGCEEDWMALYFVVGGVREAFGLNISDAKLRDLTLQVVSRLLASGKVEAGCPTDAGGWEPWKLSPKAVLTRIEAEWDAQGVAPDIGCEIVWFVLSTNQADLKS